jgi:hypothetical protein
MLLWPENGLISSRSMQTYWYKELICSTKISCVKGLSEYTQTTKHNRVSQIKDTDTCLFFLRLFINVYKPH